MDYRREANRGQGTPWPCLTSETGNLYASLLLVDPAAPELLSSLPLAVSLAVYGALRRLLPGTAEPLEIKWPNDVLIGRKKSCGILLEAELLRDGRRAVVSGIGVNIRHRPYSAPYGVTSLQEQGCTATPDEVFAHLYSEMIDVLNILDHGRGSHITSDLAEVACGYRWDDP